MNGIVIDCFAGGGGASQGIEQALNRPVDIAVNHDPQAIRMHKVNHPDTLHLTEDIFTVDLERYVAGRHVALMWASPDCTSHSKAKGGQPRNRGLRILPWAVFKHARKLLPDVIIMENVEEIQQWGPLDAAGFPIKERAGEEYRRFIAAMQKLGYDFDSRELIAADYGAPTTRRRWYAVFRRDGKPIRFPMPTHSRSGLWGEKWRACGDYIDWTDPGVSIFGRQKPLAEATMRRIANGVRKFIVENPAPYIVQNGGMLAASYLDKAYGGNYGGCGSDLHNPSGTITTVDHHRLVTAFLIQYHSEKQACECRGQLPSEPIRTIDTVNRYGLVSAYLTKFYHTGTGQSCSEPLHTITASGTHFGLVSAFLIKYYRTGGAQSLDEPVHTIRTHDCFGLVTVPVVIDDTEYIIADICLRMLKPEELKRMQGFPADYIIDRDADGVPYPKTQQVARIGNSVVPVMAQKLVEENCGDLIAAEQAAG